MTDSRIPRPKPRKVTRGYAFGLVSAVVVLVAALLIATWGLIGLFSDVKPVGSGTSSMLAPALVIISLLLLFWFLWGQTKTLLRGHKISWSWLIVVAGSSYLFWSLCGMLFGLNIKETWLSPYALAVAIIWPIGVLVFWFLLMRKIYTDKNPPRWPWELRDEAERQGRDG